MSHPADKPIGWEWAERYPHVYRDPPLALQRSACPICGHPTGDCTEEDHEAMAKPKKAEETADQPLDTATLQGGRLTAEEANRRSAASEVAGPTMVVVKEDVVGEVEDPWASTRRSVLKYHKGQVITEEEARANKVKAVQQQDIQAKEKK